MANQTITTDSNHDALTGRAAGEDITINSGATLTIDSCVSSTAMGILGDITLSDGVVLIDGRSVQEIDYSSGSGSLPSIGDTITGGTSGATAKYIEQNSGDNTAGTLTFTVLSGTFSATETITSGGWSATLDTVAVGFLKVFGEDQDWGMTGFATLRTRGDWYEVGTGDGTDSQAFTLPHSGQQCCIWVETGSGTGVFERWLRTEEALTDFGVGDLGRVFTQTLGSSTATFGTSTNGGRPASGARLRIPNVHLGTTTTGSPTTEVFSTPSANILLAPIQSTADIDLEYLNASSVQMEFWAPDNLTLKHCSVPRSDGDLATAVLGAVVLEDCGFVQSNGYSSQTNGQRLLDCVSIDIDDCDFGAQFAGTGQAVLVFETSANITIDNVRCLGADPDHTYSSADNTRFTTCSNVTINGIKCIRGEFEVATGSNGFVVNDFEYSDNPTGNVTGTNSTNMVEINGGSSGIVFDGVGIISGGVGADSYSFYYLDSSDITVRDSAGVPTSKWDLGGMGDGLIYCNGSCKGILFQRIYFENFGAAYFGEFATTQGVTFENCSVDYASRYNVAGSDMTIKGCHGASGALNSGTGMEVDFGAVVGTTFADVFTSDTQGRIHLLFTGLNGNTSPHVSIDSGTPVFRKDGDLYMRTAGDQITFTWPHQILGHTGFQALDAVENGFNTGNWHAEYSLDTGAGFGAFKAATSANLSGETISAAGFGLKIRLIADSSSSFNIINGLYLSTTTTLAAQASNLYPLTTPVDVNVTVRDGSDNSVIENARVYLLTDSGGPASSGVEVINGLTNASGQVSASYGYTSDQGIEGWVRKGSSSPYYKSSPVVATIGSSGLNLTVVMTPDE
jgi:hypothetical protein